MTLSELLKISGCTINLPEVLNSKKLLISEGINIRGKSFKRWLLKPSKGRANLDKIIHNLDSSYTSIILKRIEGEFLFELK